MQMKLSGTWADGKLDKARRPSEVRRHHGLLINLYPPRLRMKLKCVTFANGSLAVMKETKTFCEKPSTISQRYLHIYSLGASEYQFDENSDRMGGHVKRVRRELRSR